MKKILLTLTITAIVSCILTAYIMKPNKTATMKREGKVEFIHYKTSESTSTLLTGQDYQEKRSATNTIHSMNPHVILMDTYIEISYPAQTKIPKRVIPREALMELRWEEQRH